MAMTCSSSTGPLCESVGSKGPTVGTACQAHGVSPAKGGVCAAGSRNVAQTCQTGGIVLLCGGRLAHRQTHCWCVIVASLKLSVLCIGMGTNAHV
jgi:hypothetical protein